MDLSGEQEKYLIRMRGPDDIFQFIVRDLASVTNISNAAILYDDTFVMTHHYKNLLLNLPVRHLINKLVTGDMKMIKEQIQRIQGLDIRHFFILASQENIQNTLNAANQLRMYGEQFAWFAGTKVASFIHHSLTIHFIREAVIIKNAFLGHRPIRGDIMILKLCPILRFL